MKKITVFTPTYDRDYCLSILYKSLIEQTNKNFIWMIVDDGSSDDTEKLVKSWIYENLIEIDYIYKENGGMHSAHNVAYENIKTEINMCIDSDDFLPNDAIEIIYNRWEEFSGNSKFAGLIGLDQDVNKKIIGTKFKNKGKLTTLDDFYYKEKGRGDKKVVLKTELTTAYPKYPEYVNEKLVPLDSLYTLICRDYLLVPVNDIFCTVDYQPDGSSATIVNQYFKSPNGFRYAREINIRYCNSYKMLIKNVIHYNISTFIIGDLFKIIKSPKPLLTIVLSPLSYVVFKLLNKKIK